MRLGAQPGVPRAVRRRSGGRCQVVGEDRPVSCWGVMILQRAALEPVAALEVADAALAAGAVARLAFAGASGAGLVAAGEEQAGAGRAGLKAAIAELPRPDPETRRQQRPRTYPGREESPGFGLRRIAARVRGLYGRRRLESPACYGTRAWPTGTG